MSFGTFSWAPSFVGDVAGVTDLDDLNALVGKGAAYRQLPTFATEPILKHQDLAPIGKTDKYNPGQAGSWTS